jgi:radical SAM protein with 4Fe4S-binding SPASM domain
VLAYEIPTWMVFTLKEFRFFQILRRLTLRNSMIKYSKTYKASEASTIRVARHCLFKIQEAMFFNSNKGFSEEKIDNVPHNIQINLTNACNFRCAHCYLSAGIGDIHFLDEEAIVSSVEDISKKCKIDFVVLSGGEPLIFPSLANLAARLKKFHLVLFTNGSLLNSSNAPLILKYFKEVQISLEGVTKAAFEKIRGQGNYEKVLNAINLVKKSGIKLTLAITILPSTIEDIQKNLISFVQSINYDRLEVRLNNEIEMTGNAVNLDFSNYNKQKSNRIVLALYKKLRNLGFSPVSPNKRGVKFLNCGIGASFVINYDGFIYPCNKFTSLRVPIAHNCSSIVPRFNKFNELTGINNIKRCTHCKLRYICSGMCKIDNFQKNGSVIKPACSKETRRQALFSLLRSSL